MKKKRLVARIMIVICLLSYPLIVVCVNLIPYLNGFYSNLGERLNTLDGPLYDVDGQCFTVQDFQFGEDLSKTVNMLDLGKWYPPKYVNELVEEMKDSDAAIHELGDNNVAFIAFGGKKYVLSFRFSPDLKCYMLRFSSVFEPPKLGNMSSMFYTYINHLSYEDSVRYFTDLMNAFLEEYGTPAAQQSDIELPENSQAACNYARWERTSEAGISFVQLSAQTFDNSSQSNPSLGIYIDIGQTIPGISIGDLMSYLPNAELKNAAK